MVILLGSIYCFGNPFIWFIQWTNKRLNHWFFPFNDQNRTAPSTWEAWSQVVHESRMPSPHIRRFVYIRGMDSAIKWETCGNKFTIEHRDFLGFSMILPWIQTRNDRHFPRFWGLSSRSSLGHWKVCRFLGSCCPQQWHVHRCWWNPPFSWLNPHFFWWNPPAFLVNPIVTSSFLCWNSPFFLA